MDNVKKLVLDMSIPGSVVEIPVPASSDMTSQALGTNDDHNLSSIGDDKSINNRANSDMENTIHRVWSKDSGIGRASDIVLYESKDSAINRFSNRLSSPTPMDKEPEIDKVSEQSNEESEKKIESRTDLQSFV